MLAPKDIELFFDWTMRILQLITLVWSVSVIGKTIKSDSEAPGKAIEARVTALEARADKVDARLEDGEEHFSKIDEGNTITQQCILAMMDAQISGDNMDELKKQRSNLYNYLSGKGNK